MASKAFCEAMADPSADDKTRMEKLRAAVKYHVRYMRAATNGDGVDRHMLALKLTAITNGIDLPDVFTDKAFNLPFNLSTSQTPATSLLGGGFAPLNADGYGVAYVVAESRLWFHISAFTESSRTDALRMHAALKKALLDMYQMCMADPSMSRAVTKKVFSIMRTD